MTSVELINALKHVADDHPCCADTMRSAADHVVKLEDEIALWREAFYAQLKHRAEQKTLAEKYRFLRSGEITSIDWVSDPDGDVVAWAGTNPPIEFRGKTLDDVVDAAIVFHDDGR
jgi:hypothetical protein